MIFDGCKAIGMRLPEPKPIFKFWLFFGFLKIT